MTYVARLPRAQVVALRKESVDRNYKERPGQKARPKSLSARRAWIEIMDDLEPSRTRKVALRKESVDRNSTGAASLTERTTVALRKESVDRNRVLALAALLALGRSPQGERG